MHMSLSRHHKLPLFAAVGLFFVILSGAGFYGWLRHGSSMLLSFAEGGLSWCL